MPLPELQTTGSDVTNPIESLPAPQGEAIGSAALSGLERTLGASLETQAIGKLAGGTQFIPPDQAKSIMENNGYDPNVLPKDGVSNTELNALMSQQSIIKRNEAIVRQSKLSGWKAGVASFAGGAADPLFLAAGPVLGRLGFAVKGMGIGGRIATGFGEGAVINGGYTIGQKYLGTAPGDHDIGTKDVVEAAAVGGIVGAVLHGTLGPRPAPVADELTHQQAIQQAIPGVTITSALRSAEHNAEVGGVKNSMHLSGQAMDFVLPKGMTADEAKAALQAKGLPITEWLVEKKGDPHSTGDHIHWGWGDKSQVRGQPDFSEATQSSAADALQAAATDATPVPSRIAYHGTSEDFAKYDLSQGGKFGASDAKHATFFTDNADVAGGYADFASLGANRGEGVNIRPVSMDLNNPKEIDWGGEMYSATKFKAAILEAKKAGHDGVIFKNVQDDVSSGKNPSTIYAVFDANKSTKPYFGPRATVEKPPTPTPGSMFTEHPMAKAQFDKMASRPDVQASEGKAASAESAQLQKHTDDAMKEAEHAHSLTNGAKIEGAESPIVDELAQHEEDLHNAGYSDEMVKAIQAAVRCGAVKGLG